MRTFRVIKRLIKYYQTARSVYDEYKDGNDETNDYCRGRCVGFRYALAHMERRDISSSEKEKLLRRYEFQVTDEGLKKVFSSLRELVGSEICDPGLDPKDPGGGLLNENFKRGFTNAIELSYRLFDDTFNYMSFGELFRAMINKGK
ncbi:MAG: hypothetical protein U9R44_01965 [Candidatus Omnitrophota bacterium]|nr:hypothetical protein [Candidatus Omnitrophota bacterium]